MKNTGLNGYVYAFLVDYDTNDIRDIYDTRIYLMKKNHDMIQKSVWTY